jgi:hypothetical protein
MCELKSIHLNPPTFLYLVPQFRHKWPLITAMKMTYCRINGMQKWSCWLHWMSHKLTFKLIIRLLYASAITAAKGSVPLSAILLWWFLEPNPGSWYCEGGFCICLQTTTVPYQCRYCFDINEAADLLLPCTKLATRFCSCWLFQAFV